MSMHQTCVHIHHGLPPLLIASPILKCDAVIANCSALLIRFFYNYPGALTPTSI